jgi:hypothetical protein
MGTTHDQTRADEVSSLPAGAFQAAIDLTLTLSRIEGLGPWVSLA